MSLGTKKHTHICTFAFRCNLSPETIWNITGKAENRDLLMESILRLTLSLWIYLFLNKVQGHSRKVSWRMSIEQMQRCNCHPSPVLLDYTALVHSHAWKHLIVSKLDFGSRFQKKRSSKIWSSNQLLKLWAINVSIIAMHWIILKSSQYQSSLSLFSCTGQLNRSPCQSVSRHCLDDRVPIWLEKWVGEPD